MTTDFTHMNTKAWITPCGNLIAGWWKETQGNVSDVVCFAAQWGADQELEACRRWVRANISIPEGEELHTARRPEPLSLKEQALGALGRFNSNAHTRADEMTKDFDLLRRALEKLDV